MVDVTLLSASAVLHVQVIPSAFAAVVFSAEAIGLPIEVFPKNPSFENDRHEPSSVPPAPTDLQVNAKSMYVVPAVVTLVVAAFAPVVKIVEPPSVTLTVMFPAAEAFVVPTKYILPMMVLPAVKNPAVNVTDPIPAPIIEVSSVLLTSVTFVTWV